MVAYNAPYHIAADLPWNCKWQYDGFRAGTDYVCIVGSVGWSQSPADRKCDRTGIYDGEQLEPRCRVIAGTYGAGDRKHGIYVQI